MVPLDLSLLIEYNMVNLNECLMNDTPIVVVSDKEPKKGLFRKVAKPRKYFIKEFNPAEFVGEEICLINNINVSHYFLACIGSFNLDRSMWYEDIKGKCQSIRIASPNFEKPGYQYKSVTDYGFSQKDTNLFDKMLSVAKDEDNEKKLCMDMLKMLALDIYMGQTDRFAFNYLFEEDSEHNVRLAPLFDFEYSLNPQFLTDPNDLSYGDLYHFGSIEECKEFIRRYPKFRDILASYLDMDLEYAIRSAYGKRRMRMPESKYPFYRDFDEKRKELIKRIVQ